MPSDRSRPRPRPDVAHVYPRMLVGGAERTILQLLAEQPGAALHVTAVAGAAAEEARRAGHAVHVHERAPRTAPLVRALREHRVVHLHTINDHPLLPLAGMLAGPEVLLQTVHNQLDARSASHVDHSLVLDATTRELLATPGRTTRVTCAVDLPEPWSAPEPWFAAGRPLRLVEVRREDKAMRWTLEDLLATGLLDDLELELHVVGLDGPADDARVRRHGLVPDAGALLAQADVLVHGSASETFGRVVFEALAHGLHAFASDLEVLRENLGDRPSVGWSAAEDALGAARDLRRFLDHVAADGASTWAERARTAREAVAERFGRDALRTGVERAEQRAREERPARTLLAGDVPDTVLDVFGEQADRLLDPRATPDPGAVAALPPTARGALFWLAARSGRCDRAGEARQLRGAVELLGPRPGLCEDLGRALLELERWDEALPWLERAHTSDPGRLRALELQVEGQLLLGRSAAARASLVLLRQRWPQHPALALAVGELAPTGTSAPGPVRRTHPAA